MRRIPAVPPKTWDRSSATKGWKLRQFLASVLSLATVATVIAGVGAFAVPRSGAAVSPAQASAPDTPVEQQLKWLLYTTDHQLRTSPTQAYQRHFSSTFQSQISLQQLAGVLQGLNGPTGMHLVRIMQETPTFLEAVLRETGPSELRLTLAVDGSGKIDGLRFTPVSLPLKGWAGLQRQLVAIAPGVSFNAAAVRGGTCSPIYSIAPTTPRPLGSMFKLFVLGALAERIRDGRISWTQRITVQGNLKSLPSGTLQNEPNGTTFTVDQVATDMIAHSDNTAANLLINLVGRAAVERQVRKWSNEGPLNTPFLNTRELFVLKLDNYPTFANHYLSLDRSGRANYLAKTIDVQPLSDVILPKTPSPLIGLAETPPRDVDSIEWFASSADICRVFAGLSALAAKPGLSNLNTILSANDGGLRLDPSMWPTVWFKGGDEAGVTTLGYLARDGRGRTFVITALAENAQHPIAGAALLELQSLIRSGFKRVR